MEQMVRHLLAHKTDVFSYVKNAVPFAAAARFSFSLNRKRNAMYDAFIRASLGASESDAIITQYKNYKTLATYEPPCVCV